MAVVRRIRISIVVALLGLTALPLVASQGAEAETTGPRFAEVARLPFSSTRTPTPMALGGLVLDPDNRVGARLIREVGGGDGYEIAGFGLDPAEGSAFPEYDRDHITGQASLGGSYNNVTGVSAVFGDDSLFVVESDSYVRKFKIDPEAEQQENKVAQAALFPPPLPAHPSPARSVADLQLLTAPGRRRTPVGNRVVRIGAVQYWDANATHQSQLLILTEEIWSIGPNDAETGNTVSLSGWDPNTGSERWTTRLDACRGARGYASAKYGMGLAITKHPTTGAPEAMVGCIGRGNASEVWLVGLDQFGNGTTTQALVGKVPAATDFIADGAGRRMMVLTNGGTGQSFIGVDVDRRGLTGARPVSFAFDGNISNMTGPSISAGFDPTTGRIYSMTAPSQESGGDQRSTDGGVVLFDGRINPLPQGLSFPEVNPEDRAGASNIVVEPARGDRPTRVYVRYGQSVAAGGATTAENFYRVFEDTFPLQRPVEFGAEADALTDNIPEVPGKTTSGFTAIGEGFGAKAIFTGGLYSITDPGAYVRGNPLTRDTMISLFPNPCMQRDREIVLAQIPSVTSYSDTGMTGVATPAELDDRTRQDIETLVQSCPWGGNFLNLLNPVVPASTIDAYAGTNFPYPTAVCGSIDKDPVEARPGTKFGNGAPTPPGDTYARAHCSEDGRSLTVEAVWRSATQGPVSVAEAGTRTVMQHLPTGGVAARTVSWASGISLKADAATVLRIGGVISIADSGAAGRKGTAKASLTRRWCGIEGGPFAMQACFDPDSANGRAFIEGVNRLLSQREYALEAPPADPDLLKGTEKGALAGAQKDRFVANEHNLFNNDTSRAIPALQIIHVQDSTANGRGRQVYQFAGAAATTSYRVVKSFDFGDGDFDGGDFDPPTGDGGSGDGGSSGVPTVQTPTADPRRFIPGMPGTKILTEQLAAIEPAARPDGETLLPAPLYAIGKALSWLLRNPIQALKVMALIFTAFALPLHLFERRRQLGIAASGRV